MVLISRWRMIFADPLEDVKITLSTDLFLLCNLHKYEPQLVTDKLCHKSGPILVWSIHGDSKSLSDCVIKSSIPTYTACTPMLYNILIY